MSIIATDILIKSMLEAALNDLRANSYVLEDVFSGLAADPMSAPEHGWKEVEKAIKWFNETNIPVVLQHRIGDTPKIPCISIAYEPSSELENRASLADDGLIEDYPIDRPNGSTNIPIKVKDNFTPDTYDKTTGQITMPKGVTTESMAPGQFFVSSVSGKAYEIKLLKGDNKFFIKAGVVDDFTDSYVAPKTNIWNLHRELTFLQESYSIGCHTTSDPGTTIWLWQIVFYSFLRYKEAYLESRCFELSNLRSSELMRNTEFPAENVFSKYITISGQVQADWIKFIAPRFEHIETTISIADGPLAPPGTYDDESEDCPPTWSMPGDFVDEEFEIEVEDEC